MASAHVELVVLETGRALIHGEVCRHRAGTDRYRLLLLLR